MKKTSAVILIFSLISAGNALGQETYYVGDEITITLRTGESTQHQILRNLKSGTKLQVVAINDESGYAHVILEDGTEGWALSRFLSKTPIARNLLQNAETRAERLKKQLSQTQQELNEIQKSHKSASRELASLKKTHETTAKELERIRAVSSEVVAVDEENQQLKTRSIQLETKIQTLEQENAVLKDRSDRDWFIAGTVVTLIGLVIGLLVPKIRVRKRSSWSDL